MNPIGPQEEWNSRNKHQHFGFIVLAWDGVG